MRRAPENGSVIFPLLPASVFEAPPLRAALAHPSPPVSIASRDAWDHPHVIGVGQEGPHSPAQLQIHAPGDSKMAPDPQSASEDRGEEMEESSASAPKAILQLSATPVSTSLPHILFPTPQLNLSWREHWMSCCSLPERPGSKPHCAHNCGAAFSSNLYGLYYHDKYFL